jgi:cytochrome c oxidase cbb3-type subunit 4
METYEAVARFAQNWGLVYFFIAFLGVVLFVLRPKARKTYDAAARMPLSED